MACLFYCDAFEKLYREGAKKRRDAKKK